MEKILHEILLKLNTIENDISIIKTQQIEHGQILSALQKSSEFHKAQENLQCVEDKVDNLQMDVNTLIAKTARNENRIIELTKKAK